MKKTIAWLLLFLFFALPAWAIIPIDLEWDPVSGATEYEVSSRQPGGQYTHHTKTADTEQVIYVDETVPIILTVRAFKNGVPSDYATEIECKIVTTTITGKGVVDWQRPKQAVEGGIGHTITATPATNYRVSAIKVDGVLVANPAGTYAFPNISANHELEVFFQKIRTASP